MLGDKKVRDLPRGVDEYLELRSQILSAITTVVKEKKSSNAAEERQLKKDLARLERQMEKCDTAIAKLVTEQESAAFDAVRLIAITTELATLNSDKQKLEEEWLQVTLALE